MQSISRKTKRFLTQKTLKSGKQILIQCNTCIKNLRDTQAIPKKDKTNVKGLMELRNEIKVMQLLSSAERSHPNIVRL